MAIIKDNDKGELTELFIDGAFVAGWAQFDLSKEANGRVCSMIEKAVKFGEQKKAEEIRKALGLMQ